MIPLAKLAEPDILRINAAKWLTELKAEIATGAAKAKIAYRQSKYGHKEIKDRIIEETHGKCAYCESNPLHIAYGDIEHILPKIGDIDRTFQWTNLTLGCDKCNTNKGDKDVIDPYTDDLSSEFEFFGPMIHHKDGRAKAERTHTDLKLNRPELLERRRERLNNLIQNIRRIQAMPEGEERSLLLSSVVSHEVGADREYVACVRAHLDMSGIAIPV